MNSEVVNTPILQ